MTVPSNFGKRFIIPKLEHDAFTLFLHQALVILFGRLLNHTKIGSLSSPSPSNKQLSRLTNNPSNRKHAVPHHRTFHPVALGRCSGLVCSSKLARSPLIIRTLMDR